MNLLQNEDRAGKVEKVSEERSRVMEKYMTFTVGDEQYAIEVCRIREVINYVEITEVPNTSTSVKGAISVRGSVIPILNLEKCIGISSCLPSRQTRIIIIHYENYVAGLLADSVNEVINIPPDMLRQIPQFQQFMEQENVNYFKGVIEYNNRFIMLLNTQTILFILK